MNYKKKIEPYLNNFNLKGVALNVLFDVLMFFFYICIGGRINKFVTDRIVSNIRFVNEDGINDDLKKFFKDSHEFSARKQ